MTEKWTGRFSDDCYPWLWDKKPQEKHTEPYQLKGRIKQCPCQRDCGARVPARKRK